MLSGSAEHKGGFPLSHLSLNNTKIKLTVKMADVFSEEAGGTEANGLVVSVELAKGHAQAVVGE